MTQYRAEFMLKKDNRAAIVHGPAREFMFTAASDLIWKDTVKELKEWLDKGWQVIDAESYAIPVLPEMEVNKPEVNRLLSACDGMERSA